MVLQKESHVPSQGFREGNPMAEAGKGAKAQAGHRFTRLYSETNPGDRARARTAGTARSSSLHMTAKTGTDAYKDF